jgi:hypothetical protein
MSDFPPLDPSKWPTTKDEIRAWYEAGDKWIAAHHKKPLRALGRRLWEIASKGRTIEYKALAEEFDLSPHGWYGVGFWAGLVSDYCDQIMDHEYLSAVLVSKASKTRAHPKGLPSYGYNSDEAVTKADRVREDVQGQAEVWAYCSSHANPF